MPDFSMTPDFSKMSIKEKVAYFKGKQLELVEKENAYKKANDLNQAELQVAFGLTHGKPVSVVDLISIVGELVGEAINPGDLRLEDK